MACRSVINSIRFELLHKSSFVKLTTSTRIQKIFYCSQKLSENSPKIKLKGFAEAFQKQSQIIESQSEKHDNFATLLRNSEFVDLGDPVNKVVLGTIYRVVGNDLYIDFGWKFPCICSKPKNNANSYVCGTKVKLLIKNLELSTKFLGAEEDTTLLEADCVLLGLASTEKYLSKKIVAKIFSE